MHIHYLFYVLLSSYLSYYVLCLVNWAHVLITIMTCHFYPIIISQSVVMLVFREEKSPEDEIKAWQFWHSRQHSVKQRILDAGNFPPSSLP